MKKNIFAFTALACAIVWTACERIEQTPTPDEPVDPVEGVEEGTDWIVTIRAEKAETPQTKGLDIEGADEGTTTLLKSIWKDGEQVHVYLGADCIGELTVTADGENPHKATLSGTVNCSNIIEGTTRLDLLTPRETWDYTGQTGTLLLSDDAANSIEKKFHYTLASSVLVTKVEGNAVTTESATFRNQQSIYRLSFRYFDGVSKTPISTKSVSISGASGKLVQSQVMGGAAVLGDISVTLESASTDPLFVALRNEDQTNEEILTFLVVDDNGVTYHGTKTIPAAYKPNGTFVSIKNASLPDRLDVALSDTPVNSVL